MRWHGTTAAVLEFTDHARDGVPWQPGRPRQLLAWLTRHAISAERGPRATVCANVGFRCAERAVLMRQAKAELRQALADVEAGREL
jgi:hypothetical protein